MLGRALSFLVSGRFFVSLLAVCAVGTAVFLFAPSAYADIGDSVAAILGHILSIVVKFFGGLLFLLTQGLIVIANVNYFVNSVAVTIGWKIVRDVCNMFFVLILLAIAIGTILQQEKYHYSKLLPQFIVMAIMINFSKVICGLLIDFSQVIMLTFVGAFSETGGGNFAILFNVDKMLAATDTLGTGTRIGEFVATFFLANLFLILLNIVVFVMVLVLVARIVMLWFFVVLSPFAFALNILPSTQKYASQWWEDFTNYVVVGPAMAFFLWLSLAVAQNVSGGTSDIRTVNVSNDLIYSTGAKQDTKNAQSLLKADRFEEKLQEVGAKKEAIVGISRIGTVEGFMGYIISIGMLMGTLMVSQKLGVAGGKIAGGVSSWLGDVAAGKKGMLQWNTALSSAFHKFETKQAEPWTARGNRAGRAAGQLADQAMHGVMWLPEKAIQKISGGKLGVQDRLRRQERIEHTATEQRKERTGTAIAAHEMYTADDKELFHLAHNGTEDEQLAAIQVLMERGGLSKANDENIGLYRKARKKLPPALRSELDKIAKKNNGGMALKGFYQGEDKRYSLERLASDQKSNEYSGSGFDVDFMAEADAQKEGDALEQWTKTATTDEEKAELARYTALKEDVKDDIEEKDFNTLVDALDVTNAQKLLYKKNFKKTKEGGIKQLRQARAQSYYNKLGEKGGYESYISQLAGQASDVESMERLMKQIPKEVIEAEELAGRIGQLKGEHITEQMRIAFGRTTGMWGKAFDVHSKEKDKNGKTQKDILHEKVLRKDIDGFMKTLSVGSHGDAALMDFVLSDVQTKSWMVHGDNLYLFKDKQRQYAGSMAAINAENEFDGMEAQDEEKRFKKAYHAKFSELKATDSNDEDAHTQAKAFAQSQVGTSLEHIQARIGATSEEYHAQHSEDDLAKLKEEDREAYDDYMEKDKQYKVLYNNATTKNDADEAVAVSSIKTFEEFMNGPDGLLEKNRHLHRNMNFFHTGQKSLQGKDEFDNDVSVYAYDEIFQREFDIQMIQGRDSGKAGDNLIAYAEERARKKAVRQVQAVATQNSQNRNRGQHLEDTAKMHEIVAGLREKMRTATTEDEKKIIGLQIDGIMDMTAQLALQYSPQDMGQLSNVHRKFVGDAVERLNKALESEVRDELGKEAAGMRAEAEESGVKIVEQDMYAELSKRYAEKLKTVLDRFGTTESAISRWASNHFLTNLVNSRDQHVKLTPKPEIFKEKILDALVTQPNKAWSGPAGVGQRPPDADGGSADDAGGGGGGS